MTGFKQYLKDFEEQDKNPKVEVVKEEPVEVAEEKAEVEVKIEEPKAEVKPKRRTRKKKEPVKEEKVDTNLLLIEAINRLIEKIDAMEAREIEVPTPIVNVTLPDKKVIKEVVRDEKGFVKQIIEKVDNEKEGE